MASPQSIDRPSRQVIRDPHCQRCPLHQKVHHVCLMGQGPTPARLLIIGEAPGRKEDKEGLPFIGNAGELLNEMLDKAGISREEAYVTNMVKCRPPENRTPHPHEIEACAHFLQQEIDIVKPRYILLLGATPLKVIGKTGITRQRGRATHHGSAIVLSTLHPASSFYTEGNKALIQQDLYYLKRIMRRDSVPRSQSANMILVDTPQRIDDMIEALTGTVSFDIETKPTDPSRPKDGLYPWTGEIVAFGFGVATAQYTVMVKHRETVWSPDDIDDMLVRAAARLKYCCVVGQNIKFDQLWVKVHYGIFIEASFDTMLAHYLLNENVFHDLEYIAATYLRARRWDLTLAEKQGEADADKLSTYLANDLYYTRRLYEPLSKQLAQDHKLNRLYYELLMPLANLFVHIEEHGACISVSRMAEAESFLLGQIGNSIKELNRISGVIINWRSTKELCSVLYDRLELKPPFRTAGGQPSTAESALNQLDHPIIGALKRFRAAQQEYSFFVKGWGPYLTIFRGVTRLHPSFKLAGTVTGRASAEHPNFQQITREPRVRSLVTAPPGWVLLEADLSQIELRIVAELSQDATMMETFRSGRDIHWRTALREIERGGGYPELVLSTASTLSKRKIKDYGDAMEILLDAGPDAAAEIDKQWKEFRYFAKATNFGYVYGMWHKKFRMYARDTYNIEITDKQAQASRASFFDLYSGLEKWHSKQKRYVVNQGFVRSLDGQLRRLPAAQTRGDTPEKQEAFRQAINSPVQGLAAKINFMVLLQMCDEFPWSVFRPIATVHDAILAEVRIDHVEPCAHRIEEIMRRPRLFDVFEIDMSVPIEGETKIGNWSAGRSLDKWKKERLNEES